MRNKTLREIVDLHESVAQNRRNFLKFGILGGIVIGASWFFLPVRAGNINDLSNIESDYDWLTDKDVELFSAIIPVVLAGVFVDDKDRENMVLLTLDQLDFNISCFSKVTQLKLRKLLGVITNVLTKWIVTGVWKSWENASIADIDKFLKSWSTSFIDLFRSAYSALLQLISVAWYEVEQSWEGIGFLGPPYRANLTTKVNNF